LKNVRAVGVDIDLAHRLYNSLLLSHKPWYLVGADCAQWKIGESFDEVVDQNFPLFLLGKLHP